MRANPIAQRLARLSDQWASFRDDAAARVLCWQLTAAEQSSFDAFIELESDERTAEHATLFVSLDAAFAGANAYGRRLSQLLADGTAHGEEELQRLGLATGWRAPAPGEQESDPGYWLRVCESFLHFFEVGVELGVILRPKTVSDVPGFAAWLVAVAKLAPQQVRVIVLDDADAPVLAPLLAAELECVLCTRAALDVPAALVELSDAAGNLDTPGGKYRGLFVRMGQALQAGDLVAALAFGSSAVAVALEYGLFHLAVPVHVALGANLLAHKRVDEGLARYLEARTVAQRGLDQEDPNLASLCQKLKLQACLAHGAGFAGLSRWREAALLFEETLPLAAAAQEPAVCLDLQRLSSFCHEQDGDSARAWKGAQLALQQAAELDPSQRDQGNFAALAEMLQRLAAKQSAVEARPVLARLAELQPRAGVDNARVMAGALS